MPAKLRHNGFTLVEVLVALVVTSLLLTIVMNGAVAAEERGAAAASTRKAVFLAQSLAATASAAFYSEGMRSGEEGNLRWQVTETALRADPRGRFVLARMLVEVSDRKGRELFQAETRRLKQVAGQ